jgi:hypothetical protein
LEPAYPCLPHTAYSPPSLLLTYVYKWTYIFMYIHIYIYI